MITGLKGLAADGHEINCRTCRSGKTCNVANAHGYWVGACVRYSPEKPMTNADRIRAMSDEELAEFLLNRDLGVVEKASKTTGFTYKVDREQCLVDVIDWLKQEVEGNA